MQDNNQLGAASKKINWLTLGCVLMVIAAALHSASKNIGGGDTWVAMACGRYFTAGDWASGHPDRTWQMKVLDKFGIHMSQHEPFSEKTREFIPGDKEKVGWINQNWLTHIIFYKMFTTWGGNSIVYYKFIQAIFTALFVYWAARKLGAHPLISAFLVSFGILLSRSYIDLRPNMTSILFSAIMIYLLVCWAKGQPKKILWMLPVTILWANIHGGFIFAVIIFGMLAAIYTLRFLLSSIMTSFFVPNIQQLKYLYIGWALIALAAAVFSPYGLENLTHPLLVMLGQEGKDWRGVAEWKPIYEQGFGNVAWYIVFLIVWCITFIFWTLIKITDRPKPDPFRKKNKQKKIVNLNPVNLGWIAIMFITIYISIESRRFVFLGGIVLAPFMALMWQDIISIYHKNLPEIIDNLKLKFNNVILVTPFVAAIALTGIFGAAMNDIYFKPSPFGWDYSRHYSYLTDAPMARFAETNHHLFWHMVGINDQPIKPMRFVDENNIKGIAMGEWTAGGFIPYSQTPDDKGQPGLKAFMDGRAQAAYELDHFKLWQFLRHPDIMAGNRGNYAKMIEDNKVEAAVLNILNQDSRRLFETLMNSQNWHLCYADDTWVVIIAKNSEVNQDIINSSIEQLVWHNEQAKTITEAVNSCAISSPEYKLRGIDMAMSLDEYYPMVGRYMTSATISLRQDRLLTEDKNQQIMDYLLLQRDKYQNKLQENPRLGIIENHRKLFNICQNLFVLTGDEKYKTESDAHIVNLNILQERFLKEGLLW